MTDAALSINETLVRNLPFDAGADLAPVVYLGESQGLIVVNPVLAMRSLGDLIEAAKAKPGKYSVAVPGFGSSHRIALEQLKTEAGINLMTVPFRGSLPAINNVLAGHVPIGMDSVVPLAPHVRGGRLRAIAVLGADRLPGFPDVPTTLELGLPDVTAHSYAALLAPAGTPQSVLRDLNTTVNAIRSRPRVS